MRPGRPDLNRHRLNRRARRWKHGIGKGAQDANDRRYPRGRRRQIRLIHQDETDRVRM